MKLFYVGGIFALFFIAFALADENNEKLFKSPLGLFMKYADEISNEDCKENMGIKKVAMEYIQCLTGLVPSPELLFNITIYVKHACEQYDVMVLCENNLKTSLLACSKPKYSDLLEKWSNVNTGFMYEACQISESEVIKMYEEAKNCFDMSYQEFFDCTGPTAGCMCDALNNNEKCLQNEKLKEIFKPVLDELRELINKYGQENTGALEYKCSIE